MQVCRSTYDSLAVPMAPPPVPIHEFTFQIMEEESYAPAVARLREALRNGSPGDVDGNPILAAQTAPNLPPPTWVYVHMQGPGGEERDRLKPTVIIRGDNAYLVGFINKEGKIFQLGKHGVDQKIIHGATLVGFNGNYQSLLGGSSAIPGLKLGQNSIVEAVKTVWNYRHAGREEEEVEQENADDDIEPESGIISIRRALARLVVVLCEAARLPPVFETVHGGWHGQAFVTEWEVKLINHWANVSSALLGTKKFGNRYPWPNTLVSISIPNKETALHSVYLILNKPPPGPVQSFLGYLKRLLHALVRRRFFV